MSFIEELGNRVGLLRSDANMTQADLAKAVGLSCSSIANLEAGRQEPGLQAIAALARILGVSCDFLLGSEGHTLTRPPWTELAVRVTADERTYRDLADKCWWGLDVAQALRYRGMADGLELAREHHLAVIAESRENPQV